MKKVIIAALLSAFVATPAFAEKDTGIYAGVKVGQSDVGGNAIGYGVYGGYNIDQSVTSKIAGGSQFMEKVSFAGEVEYTILGSNTIYKASSIGAVLAATYPINQQFSAIAKAGLARTVNDVSFLSSTTIGLRVGIAGQYNLNEKIGLRAGYDVFPDGFSQLSAGAVFKF